MGWIVYRGLVVAVILALVGLVLIFRHQQQTLWATLTLPQGQTVVGVGSPVAVVATGSGGAVRAEVWANGRPTGAIAQNPTPRTAAWSVGLQWLPTESGRVQLTSRFYDSGGAVIESPPVVVDVVPAGTLAFTSNRSGHYALYTMQLDGQALQQVAERGRQAAWGPNGALVYVADSALWGINTPGQEAVPLVGPEFGVNAPAWRRRLAFASTRDGQAGVVLREMGATLAAMPGLDSAQLVGDPAWSPDGRELLVAAQVEASLDIYRVSLVTGAVARVTELPGDESQPAWRPTGDGFLFTSNQGGEDQILWRSLVATQPPQVLVTLPGGATHAEWGPDGKWFLYVANGSIGQGAAAHEIFVQRFADGYRVQLTNNAADDTEPAWKPPTAEPLRLPEDGFVGEFFANEALLGDPVAGRQNIARLNLDWGLLAPHPDIPPNEFSSRWQGRFRFETGGSYQFQLSADDGARLWVDEALLIDAWTWAGESPMTATLDLEPGIHLVRVEHHDHQGAARLFVGWEPLP